ncbi:MAG: hypothetical protein M0P43_00695 [Arcobacteraceae bacterium]|nr:hypothetical protein [Arcobacteraceae bacterium]
MSIIGKCPYCKDGVVSYEQKLVRGKNTKVYTCSNASWRSEDGEMFELSPTATCSFRIWGNSLLRWGKRGIGPIEVRKLINGEDVIVQLYSFTAKKEYYKYIALDKEYGISVVWDIDVEETQENRNV